MTKITNELEKQPYAVARNELGDFSSEKLLGGELAPSWHMQI